MWKKLLVAGLFSGVAALSYSAAEQSADIDHQVGKDKYDALCAGCHGGAMLEAPKIEALKLYPPKRIVDALNGGVMSTIGLALTGKEINQVAYFLTGKAPEATSTHEINYCANDFPVIQGEKPGDWLSWGGKTGNQRFQPNESVLSNDNVKNLKLKWSFAFPGNTRSRSQPTVTAEVTYIGSQDGTVYALDNESGCVYWTFLASSEVRGALQLNINKANGERTLVFGDHEAFAYAINANTGELIWKTKAHDHPLAVITGSLVTDDDRVYVPVSSSEVVPASAPDYRCCTFRGALVGINISDGKIAWRTYTTDAPVVRGKNDAGVDRLGPSGAPVWSSPTLDPKRNIVMATTGQNYSSPATGTSDAVIAMETATGEVKWVSQVWANDAWNGGCVRKTTNCPEENGPDFDIGASAVLMTSKGGKDLILVGQKSGLTYAMDPDQKGKILWTRRVGRGGTMGGVHWGMSTDSERLYVGVSDLRTNNPYVEGEPHPGLHALNPETGEFIWRTELANSCEKGLKFLCYPGLSAAVSSSPGLVFAGALDGWLRAFDSSTGEILWSYNTHRKYQSVNGIEGQGGAIEADGPVIANGRVYVSSGYDKWAELPGNVLLVFSLDGK